MSTYSNRSRIVGILAISGALVVGLSECANAQFGRGQRGGGGFGQRGGAAPELTELGRESTREELQITEEQVAAIEEFSQGFSEGVLEQFDLMRRVGQAESDEDRAAAEAELAAFRETRTAALRDKLAEILEESQLERLDQIVLHRAGPSALAREDVAEKLGLSENQRIAITGMIEERRDALRSSFRMPRDEQAKVQQEWDRNILATLEGSQLAAWTEMLGDPPPEEPETAVTIQVPGGQRPAPQGVLGAQSGDEDTVVSSFESVDGDPDKMSFNFRYAPWEDVIREFAQRAELKPDLIDVPTGTFDYDKKGPYTPTEALDILNGYLLQRGYILVRRDDFLVSITIDPNNPIPPNLIPHISPSELYDRGRNELLTVVFSVQVEDIDELAEQVQETLGPQGRAVGIQAAQALSVTDIGTNLRRVHEMLEAHSSLTTEETVFFKAYKLQNISASDAETNLREILNLGFAVENVSQAGSGGDRDERRGWGNWGRRDNDEDRNRNNQNNSTSSSGDLLAKTQMTVNRRTNQLLVAGTQAAHTIVDEALVSIDVESNGDDRWFASQEPYLQVYRLEDADAGEVAKTLTVLMPDVVVNEDGRNDMIHIWATAEEHQQVAQWVRELDGMGGGTTVAVIPLASMDPMTARSMLSSMFIYDTDAPIIEPNMAGRQLMVRGTADQISQIKLLLAGVGEDGQGGRNSLARGPIRTLGLSGRDADRLLDVLMPAWRATHPNNIQVVPPEERSPIYDIRMPRGWRDRESTDEVDTEVDEPSTDTETSFNSGPMSPQARARLVAFFDDRTVGNPEADDEANVDSGANQVEDPEQPPEEQAPSEDVAVDPDAAEDTGPPAEIYIQIVGDEIVIFSEDQEALNDLETLLQDAMAYVPPEEPQWKVYPLQTAEAVATASMLEMLIDDTSVSQLSADSTSLTGTLGRFSSSVLGATGLDSSLTSSATLQIIPEQNLNALFVTGPSAKIEELEQFLEILDTPEWPTNDRDRLPRLIPVEHAQIADVYQIVSDVFEDYLNAGQNNGRGGNGRGGRGGDNGNPFAAFLGGGGQQGGPSETLLTLGVDEQTSHLIVSADEGLYTQISELVKSIDSAAEQANRTVRVVNLQNTNSALIQSTLTSLMPRVQVSTSGGSAASSSRSGGNDDNNRGGGGGGDDQDRIRQFFEQRARERSQQQAGGTPTGFGGFSRGGDRGSFGGFGGDRGGDRGRDRGGFGRGGFNFGGDRSRGRD